MGRKRKESNIASVMYSYVGTDDQFDDFLKMMIHDYLSVDHPYTNQPAGYGCDDCCDTYGIDRLFQECGGSL